MRPLKLGMSAFGPYAGRETIDMEKLGVNGIYLITGATGAGKTMIFDAIVFALYGETSSDRRTSGMLRSQYAKPETPTEVRLIFEYRGKKYEIRRNPTYERPKQRGEGFTEQKAAAELTMPDGQSVSKLNDVNRKVQEILGLSRGQFMQIAMIAQGDFLKLLLAKTDDRKKIFSSIFNTGKFGLLEDRLKEELQKVRAEYGRKEDAIEQELCSAVLDDGSAVDQTMLEEEPRERILEKIDAASKAMETENGELLKRRKACEDLLGQLKLKIRDAEDRAKVVQKRKESEELAKSLSGRIEKQQEAVKAVSGREPEAKQLEAQAAVEEKRYARYDELDALNGEIDQLAKAQKSAALTIKKQQDETDTLDRAISDRKKRQAALQDAGRTLANLEAEKDRLKKYGESLKDVENTLTNLRKKTAEWKTSETEVKQRDRANRMADAKFQDLNRRFLMEQAGIIAETLEDGVPCPVCGSADHPHPAVKSKEAPTEQMVGKAKKELDKAAAAFSASASDCSAKKGAMEALQGTLREKAEAMSLPADPEELLSFLDIEHQTYREEWQDVGRRLRIAEQEAQEKVQLDRTIPAEEKQLDSMRNALKDAEVLFAQRKTSLETKQLSAQKIQGELNYENRRAAEAAVRRLEQTAARIRSEIQSSKDALEDLMRQLGEIRGRISALDEQLARLPAADLGKLYTDQDALSKEKEQMDKQSGRLQGEIRMNRMILDRVNSLKAELGPMEEQLKALQSLSDTASGKITGKARIELETFVQTTLFDRIIRYANRRFRIMSGGHYELKRREEYAKNHQSGLELDVIDHYNGSEREAASLSGGESFMASLSLALGLADEIQASAGGVQLDTMFVDEGFGTFDEETLDQAMKAMQGLAEDGGRLVGIISHVSELKERIDRQLIVSKDSSGCSHAELRTETAVPVR